MKILNSEQSRQADEIAIKKYGIPGIILMENAAIGLLKAVSAELGCLEGKKIVIYAGKGNNGGDVLAAARHLHKKGAVVNIYILGRVSELAEDSSVNYGILCNLGIGCIELDGKNLNSNFLQNMIFYINEADLIIDGIFGTGLSRQVEGFYADIIKIINESGVTVISADIPSGIDTSSGRVLGIAVKAKTTVTFSYPKLGIVLYPGCEYAGNIIVEDIGIPEIVFDHIDSDTQLIDENMIKNLLPDRNRIANKGNFGRIFVITGSKGMTGSGSLCGKAALKSGSGLVFLGVQNSLYPIYAANFTEGIIIPMNETSDGYSLSEENICMLKDLISDKDAVACGPGMGRYDDVEKLTKWLILNCSCPLILDADALNGISRDSTVLRKAKNPPIVTPHLGEMSRLCGLTIDEIQENTLKTAKDFAISHNVITVLKGFRTIVALPDGKSYINPTGNPGMATAGTGDVLTGIITGLAGQGLSLAEASVAGVYIHGRAGDIAAEELGEYGLVASDILEKLPAAIKDLISQKGR